MNILVIGAHPDDIEGGCFGTIKKYQQQGYSIFYLTISLGEDGGDPNKRRIEQEEAALLVKAKVKFGNLPSAYLNNNSGRETIVLIENTVQEVRPDIIFTHSVNDRHQDHVLVNKATESACRFFKGNIFYYEGFSSLKTFKPNVFYRIDEFFVDKLRALNMFNTQAKKPYMDVRVIETLARFRACQANLWGNLVEAFEVGRIIK
jgi:LmbE family N-acetylglucosaminyl deacetylase